MNLAKRLRHIAMRSSEPRDYGKTEVLATACKALGGVLLVANHRIARDMERKLDIPAKSIDVNLDGLRGPFFVDHFALEKLMLRAANKIEEIEGLLFIKTKAVEGLSIKLDRANKKIAMLEQELEDERYHQMDQQEMNDE